MASVTNRIGETSQPRGGYLSLNRFAVGLFDDGVMLGSENIYPGITGMAVDYMTRFMVRSSGLDGRDSEFKAWALLNDSFKTSMMGAISIKQLPLAGKLLKHIGELNGISADSWVLPNDRINKAIISACRLVGFDVCARAGESFYKPVEEISPDEATIENIKTMLNRNLRFFEKYGPVVKTGFTFKGGYSDVVNKGDGDILTENAMWDLKTSKSEPKSKETLQLLMYYIMGQHSGRDEFKNIQYVGVFNSRLNKSYRLAVSDIPAETINAVKNEVICY